MDYNPTTGVWTRVKSVRGARKGWRADRSDGRYQTVKFRKINYYSHRLAWFYMTGMWPAAVDHKNRIKHDNSWSNLRLATPLENSRNSGPRKNNTSGIPGVYWDRSRGKWFAYINIQGKMKALGRFSTLEDAAAARREAAQTAFGEFYCA